MNNSQKGTFGLNNNVTFGSSLKLAQLTVLCPSEGISTEDDAMFWPKESSYLLYFLFLYSRLKRQCRKV
jgi:hypothetical protein